MLKNLKIAARLFLVGSVILLVPLFIVGVASVYVSGRGISQLAESQMLSRSEDFAGLIDLVFEGEKRFVLELSLGHATIAAAESVDEKGVEKAQPEVQALISELKKFQSTKGLGENYQGFIVTGKDGRTFAASVDSFIGVDAHERDYAQRALKGEIYIGQPALNKVSGQPFVPVAAPIRNAQGDVIGVMAAFMKIDFVNELVLRLKNGRTGYSFITNKDGLVIAHPVKENVFKLNIKETKGMEEFGARMTSGKKQVAHYIYDGVAKTAAFAPSEETGLFIAFNVATSELTETTDSVRTIILIVALTSLLVAMIVFRLFASSISRPIGRSVEFARQIAQGNLSANLEINSRDELGILAGALTDMQRRLVEIVAGVSLSAKNVNNGSLQLSSSAQQMSQGATEQAASAEEVSSSMEQMSSNIRQNADNAMQTEIIAKKAAVDTEESGRVVNEAVEAMKAIAQKITIIEEIARQTNLLALNAAIEAARAGDFGKGFAVVASEVRKLAERSQQAAGEITELSRNTVGKAELAGQMLTKLVPDIKKTAELVQEINSSSAEQDSGADQINKAIAQLDQVIQQNASASEEMASTSEELSGQAGQLLDSMSFFKVEKRAEAPKAPEEGRQDQKHISQARKAGEFDSSRRHAGIEKRGPAPLIGMRPVDPESTGMQVDDREFETY